MELIAPEVAAYLDHLVPERHPEMQAMEVRARETNFPIIGPASGYFCYLVTRMLGATSVFELGSGFGYSTAWFALAVRDNGGGTVHHVVWDEELSDRACVHLNAMGLQKIVKFHVGEAVGILAEQSDTYDVVFNDIDKEGYPGSLPVIRERLKSGGVLITDNALWHARIFDKNDRSKQTEGVREFTRILTQSDEWSTSLIPIRDGLLLARKK